MYIPRKRHLDPEVVTPRTVTTRTYLKSTLILMLTYRTRRLMKTSVNTERSRNDPLNHKKMVWLAIATANQKTHHFCSILIMLPPTKRDVARMRDICYVTPASKRHSTSHHCSSRNVKWRTSTHHERRVRMTSMLSYFEWQSTVTPHTWFKISFELCTHFCLALFYSGMGLLTTGEFHMP